MPSTTSLGGWGSRIMAAVVRYEFRYPWVTLKLTQLSLLCPKQAVYGRRPRGRRRICLRLTLR